MMIVFIGILPRMTDSLHPGNGGNPAFGNYDLDSNMRLVFYPAVLGWILLGIWISQLRFRIKSIEINKEKY
jgi:heme exporter protein C